MQQFPIILLVLVLTVFPAYADEFQEGLDALCRGDDKTAIGKLKPLADQGLAEAQWILGLMYDEGQDYKEAVKWYRKAAEQGVAEAQYHFGVMYNNGSGVPQDYVEAHKWLDLAAFHLRPSDYKKLA